MTTPIPAMQAALEALELALPLAKEEWTVRADWNTAGMAAIAKMESAISLLRAALDAGEPRKTCARCGGSGEIRHWGSTPAGRPIMEVDPCPACASPVAAAPQGDAWRPIESAPHDDTGVLLGIGDDGHDTPAVVTFGWWLDAHDDAPDEMGHDAGWIDVQGEFTPGRSFGMEAYRREGFQPTHWQPMPPAPDALSFPTLNEQGKRGC